ncbi:MAG TPA: hypothetical protein VGI29_10435 [Candidatus Binataceae bacterium]|jgi:hypothetical protein
MTDYTTSQTACGETSRNAPGKVAAFMRAMILFRQDHGSGDSSADYRAAQSAQRFTAPLFLVR